MKKSMKFVAVGLTIASSLATVSTASAAVKNPLEKNQVRATRVSNYEVRYSAGSKEIDVKENSSKKGEYTVSEGKNSDVKETMKLTVVPKTKDGVSGYDVTIVDLASNQTILQSFSEEDVFKIKDSTLDKNITTPDAIVYAVVTGNYGGLTGAATAILTKMESLGWFSVISELYAEGESVFAIASLIVSSLPELGIAIGIGTAL